MLIPRFSLRTLLAVMAGVSVLALVTSMAFRGQAWAIGASAGVAALAAILVVYAALYAIAWVATWVGGQMFTRRQAESPFADARMPPTHAAPEEP